MKKFLSFALVLIMLLSTVFAVSATSPKVSVTADKSAVSTGDEVTVSIKLGANSELAGIGVTVNFDTSEFQYVDGSATTNGLFKYENDLVISGGTVKYDGVQENIVNSAGTIFSFKLKVLKNGGKITATVHEAVNDDNQDIASSVSVSNLTLKCAHKNMNWSVTKAATCTQKGQENGVCACGYTTTRDIPMKAHTTSAFKVEKDATCTEKGSKKAQCTVCQKEFTEDIAPTGHKFGNWEVVKEATETQNGVEKSVCSVCGEIKERDIKKLEPTETTTEDLTAPIDNIPTQNEEKPTSTFKIVVLSVLGTLCVEAVLGGIIFAVYKRRKSKEE